jgi:hypothetical protein
MHVGKTGLAAGSALLLWKLEFGVENSVRACGHLLGRGEVVGVSPVVAVELVRGEERGVEGRRLEVLPLAVHCHDEREEGVHGRLAREDGHDHVREVNPAQVQLGHLPGGAGRR